MVLYFFSARSSVLLAGNGSSEGSSGPPFAVAGIAPLWSPAASSWGDNGRACIGFLGSTVGCPAGSCAASPPEFTEVWGAALALAVWVEFAEGRVQVQFAPRKQKTKPRTTH